MPSIFHAYNRLLKVHPFKTNMLTTGFFFGTGDAVAQKLFPHKTDNDEVEPYNVPRSLRAITYGGIFFAPISVLWHGKTLPFLKNPLVSVLRRKAMQESPKLKTRLHLYDTLFRLAIDQLFFPAIVWIPLYNIVMVTLSLHEHPLDEAFDKLHNNWWNVLKASWTVWPAFPMLNLFFIPVHLRIVAANIWSTGWNAFLSFVHNTKGHGKGSGRRVEEIVDIEDDQHEVTMVYD